MSKPYSQSGEKGTDTNQASELYELCKEVYKRTGWSNTDNELSPKGHLWPRGGFKDFHRGSTEEPTPLYTSDYLLEKLPATVQSKGETYFLMLEPFEDKTWHAVYGFSDRDSWYNHEDYKSSVTDTPLKALLKLTIALSEAGELNG